MAAIIDRPSAATRLGAGPAFQPYALGGFQSRKGLPVPPAAAVRSARNSSQAPEPPAARMTPVSVQLFPVMGACGCAGVAAMCRRLQQSAIRSVERLVNFHYFERLERLLSCG